MFRRSDFRAVHADPRILIVKVTTPSLKGFIHVCHAPYHRHPKIDPCKWWSDLEGLANKYPPIIVLGDMNASLGSRHGVHREDDGVFVGNFHPAPSEAEDDVTGRLLYQFMINNALYAENTFHEHEGGYTFAGNERSHHGKKRIDFILTDSTYHHRADRLWVDYSIDTHTVEDDHFPVMLQIKFQ
eukprot:902769-Pyramimonas_sp.AAC.1